MDNDGADPEPLDPQAAAGQQRVTDQLLILGLIAVGFYGAAAYAPAWPLFEVGAAPLVVTLPLLLWLTSIGFGVTFSLLQAHYVMRFMWARGQFVHLDSVHWDEHGNYFLATILVAVAWGLLTFLPQALAWFS